MWTPSSEQLTVNSYELIEKGKFQNKQSGQGIWWNWRIIFKRIIRIQGEKSWVIDCILF